MTSRKQTEGNRRNERKSTGLKPVRSVLFSGELPARSLRPESTFTADPEQLVVLKKGVQFWNNWRKKNPSAGIRLDGADFGGLDLSGADLKRASLKRTSFMGASLDRADLRGASAMFADFRRASLKRANLARCNLRATMFHSATMDGVDLRNADLAQSVMSFADLQRADLRGAELWHANLIGANLRDADLTKARVFGVSAWNVRLEGAIQQSLIITRRSEPEVAVDNLEVAQFVYLILKNENLRGVIETIGSKGVLILGRFTERREVLEAIKSEVRRLGYLPIVFDFERPNNRDLSETVMTLAGMSRFIIADITKPKSVPLELEATVPNYMIPFVPIIEQGERPFAMFQDLWKKYREWVLAPLVYDTVQSLVSVLNKAVIEPANERLLALRRRKAEELVLRSVKDYQKARE